MVAPNQEQLSHAERRATDPGPRARGNGTLFTPEERDGLRLVAWLDLDLPLLAPPFDASGRRPSRLFEVAPFTVERDALLDLIGSPLRTGLPFDRFSLITTLWVLSPAYRRGAWWRFLGWALNRIFLPFDRTAAALRRWDDAQFIDRPPRAQGHATTPASRTYARALFVLNCKHRLALSEREVLSLPIARGMQQLAALETGRGGEVPHFDPERAAAVGAWLRSRASAANKETEDQA